MDDETVDLGKVGQPEDFSQKETVAPGEAASADGGPVPERFGKYEIVKELGRGGMAVVYEAVDTVLSRRVALKLLPLQYSSDATFVERFQREAQAAARLNHPAVISIFDVGDEAGTRYIAMELVDGESLDSLSEKGKIEERRLVAICAEVAEGMDCAHSQGIVHRDIKPGNIMVDTEGRAHITDFGLAKPQEAARLTATGDILGSPAYMSPEQAGGKKLDHRTDIYSLGTVLYEFLCGSPPFSADTAIELLKKVVNRLPRRPRKLNPKIPVKLEAVILKAMEKDPADRYQSAGQLAVDLRAYLDGQPVSVRPPRFFERVDRFGKRHKVALTFVATLSLVVSISYRYVLGYIAQMRQRSALSTAEYFGARRRLTEGRPIDVFSYADSLLSERNYKAALSEYGRIARDSRKIDHIVYSHLKMGTCYEMMKNPKEAAESYHMSMQTAGTGLPELRCAAMYALYQMESAAGRVEAAIEYAVAMHRDDLSAPGVPASAVMLRNLALSVRAEGEFDRALEIYGNAAKCAKNRWRSERISLEVAETLSEKGDLASALTRLDYLSQQAKSPDIKAGAAAESIILLLLSDRHEEAVAAAGALMEEGKGVDLPPHALLIASLMSGRLRNQEFAPRLKDLPADVRNDALFARALVMARADSKKEDITAILKECIAAGEGMEWPSRLAAKKLAELPLTLILSPGGRGKGEGDPHRQRP